MVFCLWGQFHHIKTKDLPPGKGAFQKMQAIMPARPARHRRAGGADNRRIKPIHIKTHVYLFGKIFGEELVRQTWRAKAAASTKWMRLSFLRKQASSQDRARTPN